MWPSIQRTEGLKIPCQMYAVSSLSRSFPTWSYFCTVTWCACPVTYARGPSRLHRATLATEGGFTKWRLKVKSHQGSRNPCATRLSLPETNPRSGYDPYEVRPSGSSFSNRATYAMTSVREHRSRFHPVDVPTDCRFTDQGRQLKHQRHTMPTPRVHRRLWGIIMLQSSSSRRRPPSTIHPNHTRRCPNRSVLPLLELHQWRSS